MSGRKSNLKQYQTITSGDMSLSSITSSVTNIEFLDNIAIQLNFTGAPVGVFQVQVSADYNQDNNGNVLTAGNWVAIPVAYYTSGSFTTSTDIPTSAGSPIYLDLNQLAAPWVRVVYTTTSGTGTLNGYIAAKAV